MGSNAVIAWSCFVFLTGAAVWYKAANSKRLGRVMLLGMTGGFLMAGGAYRFILESVLTYADIEFAMENSKTIMAISLCLVAYWVAMLSIIEILKKKRNKE